MKKMLLFFAGISLSGLTFGQTVQRTPLYETFTSSTCAPCAPANIHLEGLFNNPTNEGKFTSLKYQMSGPGPGDPYYTSECGSRQGFYGISSIPRLEVDGGFDLGPTSLEQADMDSAYVIPAVVKIDAFYQINEADQTVSIQVEVEALEALVSSGGLFMHVAIFETQTTGNVKTNGESEFEHVMKKMVPSGSGSLLGGMDEGEIKTFDLSYTFNGDYILPPDATEPVNHSEEHSVEEFSDLGVLVWVQRTATKEVYQSMYAVAGTTGIQEELSEIKTQLSVFPNPSNDMAQISYTIPVNANIAQLTVIDNSGKLVYEKEVSAQSGITHTTMVDTKNLENGLYFVTLNTNEGRTTEKLTVVH